MQMSQPGHWLSTAIKKTKHTPLYLWFLKGAVCLHKPKAYLTDSTGMGADLGNKTLISATYMETPFHRAMFRGAERNRRPILAETVQHFRCRDKTIPLSNSLQPPGCGQCWASQRATVLCLLYNKPQRRLMLQITDQTFCCDCYSHSPHFIS